MNGCKHIQVDEPVLMRYPDVAIEYGVTDVEKCFEGWIFKRELAQLALLGFTFVSVL